MIIFKHLALRREKKLLLKEVNWTIYPGQHIGLIGENGCGKSSLFALLLGQLSADEGDLYIPKEWRFGHVAQETQATQQTALNYVLDGDAELRALEDQLQQAEALHLGERIALIHEKLDIIGAYTAPSRAAQLLNGLGFNYVEQQRPVNAFSGGWRVRLNLAKALMCRSDILLLDEPTNHLDLDAVIWLEQWIKAYQGTLLLISHDRDFLDKTVNHIAHITHQTLSNYSGDYSSFEKQRAEQLLLQQAAFEKQQKHISHMMDFVNRFKAKATKAKQAQSRLKAIERMDIISAIQQESPFQFQFKPLNHCPSPLIQLQKADIAYGEKTILKQINFSIMPGERIAMLGPNGAGKSSLIKLLAGELTPAKGERSASTGLKIGYFAQHQVDHLRLTDSSLSHLKGIAPHTTELELRKFLGSFGFSGDKVMEPIHTFSGGEKSRLALALLVWQQPNLLLLDEPTNHLDLEMRNALSLALQSYEGAMILVSHDRFLVRSTTDVLWLVAEGEVKEFAGDLNDYQRWLLDFRKEQSKETITSTKSDASRKEQRQQNASDRARLRPLVLRIKQLEKKLETLQKQFSENEALLADANLYESTNKEKLQSCLFSQAQLKKALIDIEEEWLNACDEHERLAQERR